MKPFEVFSKRSVSLVVLARSDNSHLAAFVARYRRQFHDVVVVLDGSETGCQAHHNVRYVTRRLAGDFGSQRNAGTAAAGGDWVFHLDIDEEVDADFCSALQFLAGAADENGIRAVGFPRRNFVDDVLSDLFPDVQYRLIRRDVLFEGRVHERPEPCRSGSRTIVSQHGAIDHALNRERILQRSMFYDSLGQERVRHEDDAALLRAFEP